MKEECSTHEVDEKCTNYLVGKSVEKRHLGMSKRTWKNSVKTDLMDTEEEAVVWIRLAQDRDRWRAVVNTVMNLPFP
jgi:hypothetical protein